jgi:hypothetical protein
VLLPLWLAPVSLLQVAYGILSLLACLSSLDPHFAYGLPDLDISFGLHRFDLNTSGDNAKIPLNKK